MDKLSFLTRNVELATAQDTGNLIAKFVLCDFSVNGNGVTINRENAENWIATLVNQPVVGRIGYSGDFTGHNMRVGEVVGADGQKRKEVMFDTEAIGTFTSVAIETIDNDECIVGSAEIWSRYPLVCELIKKRVAEGTLHTSWEIKVTESHMSGDTKVIDNGCFTALCVLGKNVTPAYDVSRMLEVAESYEDAEFSEALSKDISENTSKEDTQMDIEKEMPEEVIETSAMTMRDLRNRVEEAICKAGHDCCVEYIFPEEHIALVKCYRCGRGSELQFEQFAYTVEDDTVTIVGDPIAVELVASPLQINKLVAEKDDALSEAASRIAELNSTIAELQPYKDEADRLAAEKEAAEIAERVSALRAYAAKSGLITDEEVASGEICNMINELNEAGVKQIIAERFMESLQNKTVEVSEKKESAAATMNLYDGDSDNVEVDLVSAYINHNKKG